MKAKDYNLDWSEWFELDEKSPSGLVWNVPQYFKGTPNYTRVGQPVGSITKTKNNQYWVVGLSENYVRSTYQIHRIIWVMLNGSVSENNDVDHQDGDGLNNKHLNLREVPKSVNSRNKRMRRDNTTGVTGVHYIPEPNRNPKNISDRYGGCVIDVDGNALTKSYSIRLHGEETARQMAIDWYEKTRNETDTNYTERHGRD